MCTASDACLWFEYICMILKNLLLYMQFLHFHCWEFETKAMETLILYGRGLKELSKINQNFVQVPMVWQSSRLIGEIMACHEM